MNKQSSSYFGVAVHDGKVGVLDIGSNSVRLVIYDGMKRVPMPIFNEKALCELGRDVATTGCLHAAGVEQAKSCIARFLAMAKIMDVIELHILATAAIRDAKDGKDFVDHIEKTHGVRVKVISGDKEAKLAARGVMASIHKPSGLVGDLGGGSLELIRIDQDKSFEEVSLPFGTLRLQEASGYDVSEASKQIAKAFDGQPWLTEHKMKQFYAIGGTFRMLAHMHILSTDYPLEVLHAYSVKAADFIPFLLKIAATEAEEIASMPGASNRRSNALKFAAVTMAELLEHTGIEEIVFSTAGIREGFLYEQLSPYLKEEDALISCCVDLASQNGRVGGYARDLFHWMSPLFPEESERSERVRFACCVLSEFAWRVHPQYRAEWQFTRIIQSSFVGLTHLERVALASALYHRHKLKTPLETDVLTLLSDEQQLWCQVVGQAMWLGFLLSGGEMAQLSRVPLQYDEATAEPSLEYAPELQDLDGETVQKLLLGLGSTLKALRKRDK